MEIDKVYHGNNIEVLKTFPDNSVDSVVTDPPYGISFMNKHWDYDVPTTELWQEVYRVLKPGGHMLVACGTRTQHRMAVNIEDAGFEIRDIVAWIYGSGFPKSYDIAKGIEGKLTTGSASWNDFHKLNGELSKAQSQGANGLVKLNKEQGNRPTQYQSHGSLKLEPTTDQAKQYQGWGTALKPAMELWTLARKPLIGTVAENVLEYGTGGLNIDGCRIELQEGEEWEGREMPNAQDGVTWGGDLNKSSSSSNPLGRFPANVIHDGSEEVVELFPNDGETSAARFFYCPKASKEERNMGLYGFEEGIRVRQGLAGEHKDTISRNIHPTVKPLDLMRYLVRLVTPKGGIVLDPYVGSGTTAIAAKQEKMHYIGIELEKDYVEIAEARIKAAIVQYDIFDFME